MSHLAKRPLAIHGVAWSIAQSVGLLDTFVSPANTAEPIEMPFWMVSRVS